MDENSKIETHPSEINSQATPITPKKKSFAETAAAAKMSGLYNQTAGKIKRKVGEIRGDDELHAEGHKQEIIGKIHRLVGSFRGLRDGSAKKLVSKRKEAKAICIKHGGRLLDVAGDLVEDLKNIILK